MFKSMWQVLYVSSPHLFVCREVAVWGFSDVQQINFDATKDRGTTLAQSRGKAELAGGNVRVHLEGTFEYLQPNNGDWGGYHNIV